MKYTENTERYAVAVLRHSYAGDLKGTEKVLFVTIIKLYCIEFYFCVDPEYFDRDYTQAIVRNLNNETYRLSNTESSRPDYYIVDEVVADYIASGRNGDGTNYNWDDCGCTDGDDNGPCGDCNTCYDYMIEQDRQYIISNAVKL